jgi:predicted nucleic acid-binding protein
VSAVVVDASVAVKWFFPEPHAQAARQVLSGRRTLLAPELIWAEVANVLWKRVRREELAPEAAWQILQSFRRFPFHTSPIKTLLEPAWRLAVERRISVYDGLYLALAVSRECKLVTADRPFHDAIKAGALASSIIWVEHVS